MPATLILSAHPGRRVSGGRQIALNIGERVPQRSLDVTDVLGVISAVARFRPRRARRQSRREFRSLDASGRRPQAAWLRRGRPGRRFWGTCLFAVRCRRSRASTNTRRSGRNGGVTRFPGSACRPNAPSPLVRPIRQPNGERTNRKQPKQPKTSNCQPGRAAS
jgi:hypothetical protein